MNMVDDATGTTWCRMGEEETIWAAVGVLKGWIRRYGIPQALYTDWKNVYVREPNEGERQRGEVPVTQFGRMCQRLGIQIIAASSPQAKGRVERNHGTHQDRLVKKLRRRQIRGLAEVNGYLEEEYCPEHNRRFAVAAASKEDYHLPSPGVRALRTMLRLETERVLSNDWVVRHANRFYQVERQSQHHAPAKSKVLVYEWEDGTMDIQYRGQRLKWNEIGGCAEARKTEDSESKAGKEVVKVAERRQWKPGSDHPWRRRFKERTGGLSSGRPPVQEPGSLASASASP
jgi:hypothetical protein